EYFLIRGGGTPFGFINAVFQDVLGHAADAAAIAFWGPVLAQTSPTEFAFRVLQTVEADQAVIRTTYQATLRRPVDASRLSYWTGVLQGGFDDDDFLASLAASDEYYRKATR